MTPNKVLIYIHGKGGSATEAEHYKDILPQYEIVGLDYKGQTPWHTKKEFIEVYNKLSNYYENIGIITNSIGAYFSMNAFFDKNIERAFFISPIVDMEKLITDMMLWADIDEADLVDKKEIVTSFGETLSWKYLCYVRTNPIIWKVPTDILYGENDNLTSFKTIFSFAHTHNASLTVMKNGEHWFHTAEQMKFLDNWLQLCLEKQKKEISKG